MRTLSSKDNKKKIILTCISRSNELQSNLPKLFLAILIQKFIFSNQNQTGNEIVDCFIISQ